MLKKTERELQQELKRPEVTKFCHSNSNSEEKLNVTMSQQFITRVSDWVSVFNSITDVVLAYITWFLSQMLLNQF